MKVQVQYFAVLRDQAGLDREEVDFAGSTASELYRQLVDAGRVSLPAELVRPAVNGRFAEWESDLQNGDDVVFIPPVAGG